MEKAPNPYIERDMRPLRERGTMWSADATAADFWSRPDLGKRVYRNYLGVLALLGRLAELVPKNDFSARHDLEGAFIDANEVLRRKDGDVFFERSSRGGFSMFDGKPLPPKEGA
jgi:hypothetical protein